MRVCPHCRLIYQNPVFEKCGLHEVRLVEEDRDPLVGTSLDRYEIMELLGAGAMGRVYKARHAVLGRTVAIKVLCGDHACEESFRLRFEREAQAVGRMSHPNLVSVTDYGTVEGLPFLVMDHLQGRTLQELIEEQAPFNSARAAHILRQIACGLDEAHRQGFVHRDMKPSNVMIAGEEPNESAMILDLGVAVMISAGEKDPNVALSSDIYSAGVILHEMLSGRPPSEPPPPLPDCGGIEKLAMRMLEKDPKNRPECAGEVIAELDRLREANIQTAVVRERAPSGSSRTGEVARSTWSPPKPKPVAQELTPVLVLESDRDLSIEIERQLDRHLFRVHHASRLEAGSTILQHETISAIVLNLTLPDGEGLETLDRARAWAEDIPIVIVSKLGHEWLAVEAIRRGADDYLICSAEELRRLQRSVRFAIERRQRRARLPPEPITSAMLSVNSRPPGAEVWIDGTSAGKTPLILHRPRDLESIEVELRLSGYQRWSQRVTKNESGHFVVNAELVAITAP